MRARGALRGYARASQLAIALVGVLLLLWMGPAEKVVGTGPAPAFAQAPTEPPTEDPAEDLASDLAGSETQVETTDEQEAPSPGVAVEEATGTLRDILLQLYSLFPKLAIAVGIMLAGWLISRLIRGTIRRTLSDWDRATAVSALIRVVVFLVALALALAIIAGDSRALVGSVGLAGLALSWALQAPIESFTGWLLNSFQRYYRVGDRIGVGEVFGDVYRIDILTTMVWEAGGPNKPVQGAQPTGALITFPNSEVLRSNIINYTRDFPHVWDEVTIGVTCESDLPYSMELLRRVAGRVLGPVMEGPAREYRKLLARTKHLGLDVATEPQVYASNAESWTDLTVRYLVPARERRKWSSDLNVAISVEIMDPEHAGRISIAYPRTRIDLLRVEDTSG